MAITPTITLLIDGGEDGQSAIPFGQRNAYAFEVDKSALIIVRSDRSSVPIQKILTTIQTDIIGYIPRQAFPSGILPDITSNFLAVLPPEATLPAETAKEISVAALGWIASTNIVKSVLLKLGKPENWTILEIAKALEKNGVDFKWSSVRASILNTPKTEEISTRIINTVLAIVPHYGCEKWLHRCLNSLTNQTRSLDGIVVVDDGSKHPPTSIVEQFPSVTLLTSPFNVGPYRLIQQVIDDTNYDAYLFQDADDWSTCDRNSKLLHAAASTGAQLVGTQEFRVFEELSSLLPVCYPLDVNAALKEKPGHALLHPTSLVTRNLVQQLGGFATGLRFGGDTEFLLRAALVARIVNVPDYCYFRQKRANSLTTAPKTGLESPARAQLLKTLKSRAQANYEAIKAGKPPWLSPIAKQEPIELKYITGSKLQWVR